MWCTCAAKGLRRIGWTNINGSGLQVEAKLRCIDGPCSHCESNTNVILVELHYGMGWLEESLVEF
jgi:hypothetical protein